MMKKTYSLFYILLFLCYATGQYSDPLCVVRLFSGDEFFNDEGPAACAAYDALCHDDGTNLAAGGDISGVLSCSCEIDQSLQCPACKCNPLHPVFNGSTCTGDRSVGWSLHNIPLVQPDVDHRQLLAIDKVFLYRAEVYGWKVMVKNDRELDGWVLLQVWRPKVGGYDLVGSTNFTYGPSRGSGFRTAEISLQEREHISVDRGYIIGFYLPNGTNGSPFNIGYADESYTLPSFESSSQVLYFGKRPGEASPPPTELITLEYDEHATQFVISLRAMIGPVVEGEVECVAHPAHGVTEGPFTTSPQGRTTFTIKFVQTVIAPVVTAVLFLLILIVGIVVSVKCIRTSLRHKKQARHTQQPKVVASLDSLERTSVFNIYPSNPVLGHCSASRPSSRVSKQSSLGASSCGTDSLYDTIPDEHFMRSGRTNSLPHTYAILERSMGSFESSTLSDDDDTLTSGQALNDSDIDADSLDKTEKRISFKDELTGQENDQALCTVTDPSVVATSEDDVKQDKGRVDESQEEQPQLDGDVDSDHDLEIYEV